MRFTRYLCALGATLILAPSLAWADLPNLKVTITGAQPATGSVEVTLFNSAETFMRSPFLQESGAVDESGQLVVEFFGLADGDYAVVVIHDVNDNGMLDTGFLGFGGESIGYSNGADPWLGRPDYEDVIISVEIENQEIEINLD